MSMKESFRSITAPYIAHSIKTISSFLFRGTRMEMLLWHILNKYVFYYGFLSTVKTTFGKKIQTNPKFMVEKQIYYFGEWEPLFSRYLLDKEKDNGVFLDLGCNIGYFTLLASTVYREVVAVEASPKIFNRLCDNIDLNSPKNIIAFNKAIASEVGMIDFYFDESQSGGSSAIPGGNRVFEEKVPCAPLFDLIPREIVNKISFIKIDLEGYERVALEQIDEMLHNMRVDLEIFVEFDPKRDGDLWDCVEKFTGKGFSVYVLQEEYNVNEYSNRVTRSELVKINTTPSRFCDLLIRHDQV